MISIIITNYSLDLNKEKIYEIKEIIEMSEFLVIKNLNKITDFDINNLSFKAWLWFKQSNENLNIYIYNPLKYFSKLSNSVYSYVNLGLFNDESITSSDKRAIPNELTKYTIEDIVNLLSLDLKDKKFKNKIKYLII